jgi:hypothetical protein
MQFIQFCTKVRSNLLSYLIHMSQPYCVFHLETVKESRKNQNFHFALQIPPTLLNGTYLHCHDWIYI